MSKSIVINLSDEDHEKALYICAYMGASVSDIVSGMIRRRHREILIKQSQPRLRLVEQNGEENAEATTEE